MKDRLEQIWEITSIFEQRISELQSFHRDSYAGHAVRLIIFFFFMGKSRIIRSISPRYTARASEKYVNSHEL